MDMQTHASWTVRNWGITKFCNESENNWPKLVEVILQVETNSSIYLPVYLSAV